MAKKRFFYKRLVFVFLAVAIASSLTWQAMFFSSPLGSASWQITEWLISYDAGFIRRGLGGEIIGAISGLTSLSPNHVAVTLSISIYFAFLAFCVRQFKIRALLPLFISPFLFGAPVFSEFVIRKDLALVVLFTCAIFVLNWPGSIRKSLVLSSTVVLGLLLHEAFIFLCLPFLLAVSREQLIHCRLNRARAIVLWSCPILITVVVLILSKGSSQAAVAIADAWNERYLAFDGYCCYARPPAAMEALGWTTTQALMASASTLTHFAFGIFYVPLVWAFLIWLSWYVISNLAFNENPDQYRSFTEIFIFQTAAILPLFVLGWDFGRWIFFINTTSFLGALVMGSFKPLTMLGIRLALNFESRRPEREPFLYILLVVSAIPHCCMSLASFISSSPLVAPFLSISRVLSLNSLQ